MGKNKKAPINAFAFFMEDFAKQHGRKFKDRRELAEAAGPHWSNLPEQQKEIYKKRAKKAKQDGAKYTSQGIKIDVIEQQENEMKLKEQDMKNEIISSILLLLENNEITTHMFHIIHVNTFCFCNSTKQFIPAELAVVRFNLQDGVIEDNVLHFTVYPGRLPIGYSADAKQTSEDSHQLPIPVGENVKDNLEQVIESVIKFLRFGISKTDKKFPPLYCSERHKEVVENVVQNLLTRHGYSEDMLKIYSLEFLFYTLRNKTAGEIVWQSISLSRIELERDVYDYCKGIACEFHENSDVPNHCSRSVVVRLAYIICDNCCPSMKIELIPGQHIPIKSVVLSAQSGHNSDTSSVYSESRDNEKLTFISAASESRYSLTTDVTSFPEPANSTFGDFDFGLSQSSQTSGWEQVKSRKHRSCREETEPRDSSFPSGFTESEPLSFNTMLTSQSHQVRKPSVPPAALGPLCAAMSLNDNNKPGSTRSSASTSSSTVSKGRGRGSVLWTKMTQKK